MSCRYQANGTNSLCTCGIKTTVHRRGWPTSKGWATIAPTTRQPKSFHFCVAGWTKGGSFVVALGLKWASCKRPRRSSSRRAKHSQPGSIASPTGSSGTPHATAGTSMSCPVPPDSPNRAVWCQMVFANGKAL